MLSGAVEENSRGKRPSCNLQGAPPNAISVSCGVKALEIQTLSGGTRVFSSQ